MTGKDNGAEPMTEKDDQINDGEPQDQNNETAAAVDVMAEKAEKAEQAESDLDWELNAEEGGEDEGRLDAQARAMATIGVKGVELAAGMIRPGHSLDAAAKATGEEALLPIATEFAGELPDWLRPYMHYVAAGMWIGGVLLGAYKARREDDAKDDRKKSEQGQEQGAADGMQSGH